MFGKVYAELNHRVHGHWLLQHRSYKGDRRGIGGALLKEVGVSPINPKPGFSARWGMTAIAHIVNIAASSSVGNDASSGFNPQPEAMPRQVRLGRGLMYGEGVARILYIH